MAKTPSRTTRNAKSTTPVKIASVPRVASAPVRSKGASASAKIARKSTDQPSKQDLVLGLLRRQEGATISAIMKTTGWQQHSVRGFLAGVVRKKLKLRLTSRDDDNGKRVYRIASGKPPKMDVRAAR